MLLTCDQSISTFYPIILLNDDKYFIVFFNTMQWNTSWKILIMLIVLQLIQG